MKKFISKAFALAMSATLFAGCSTSTSTTEVEVDKVQEAADLIDAIYVQEKTDQTEEQCKAAKEAWDALSDEEKEQVEGENADPDYFGRDTGDASKDDPLNADSIGDNEILVVSFGTSFNDSRAQDISAIEKSIQEAYPEWSVRRAFTAQIIMNHVLARDGEKIDNVKEALERAVQNGVKNLVVQPTHLMKGYEYDELVEELNNYTDKFESVSVALPLLGEVGNDAIIINEDKNIVAKAIVEAAVKDSDYDSIEKSSEDGTAFVFLGHGTSHTAKVSYSQMMTVMDTLGYDNVFIGTVEGEPEETEVENVIEAVKEAGYKNVVLRPLMVVAGDHANNDMAGDDEDSWKTLFEKEFDSVTCQIAGLGRIEAVQDIYVEHTKSAMESLENVSKEEKEEVAVLEDGEYQATFSTDSSMFHVNEAAKISTLTVKNGKMSIHVSLAGDGILNLYVGSAEDAQNDEKNWLSPTTDKVKYEDGTEEEVNGFDIPVEALDTEYSVALIGKKGKWYDHKVSVSLVKED